MLQAANTDLVIQLVPKLTIVSDEIKNKKYLQIKPIKVV